MWAGHCVNCQKVFTRLKINVVYPRIEAVKCLFNAWYPFEGSSKQVLFWNNGLSTVLRRRGWMDTKWRGGVCRRFVHTGYAPQRSALQLYSLRVHGFARVGYEKYVNQCNTAYHSGKTPIDVFSVALFIVLCCILLSTKLVELSLPCLTQSTSIVISFMSGCLMNICYVRDGAKNSVKGHCEPKKVPL